jgi:hypothetical protein
MKEAKEEKSLPRKAAIPVGETVSRGARPRLSGDFGLKFRSAVRKMYKSFKEAVVYP